MYTHEAPEPNSDVDGLRKVASRGLMSAEEFVSSAVLGLENYVDFSLIDSDGCA